MDFFIGKASPLALIIICLAVALVLTLAIIFILQRRRAQRLRSASFYLEALKEMIRGDEESAFRLLKRVVGEDTGNIDAYLKLGDILRRRGDLAAALQIHRHLTVRTDLNAQTRKELLKSLAMDHMESKKNERAIAILQELISGDRKDLWAHQQLLHLYETQGLWSQALSVQEAVFKITGQKDDALLALYEVQIGDQFVNRKEFHKARLKYKDALRRDRNCVPAYLGLGDAYQRENRLDEAIDSWKEMLIKVPEKAYLAFGQLEKALYEKGQFGEMARLYRDLLEQDPHNLRAFWALASIYDKKGDLDEAIQACERALEVEPSSAIARQLLVKFYQQRGDQAKVMENLEALINSAVATTGLFICQNCGHESPSALWRCPKCGQWRTFDL
jgi:lipopolysaccharide biosynthesis regulator YciM